MQEVYCDYCGRQAEYVDSKAIYGKSYGMIYICRRCNAYVGVHDGTDIPLGRLADSQLRYWKKAAHSAFDPIWKYGRYRGRRDAAYRWLSRQMNLSPEETHIGMFTVEQCKEAVQICNEEMKATLERIRKAKQAKASVCT